MHHMCTPKLLSLTDVYLYVAYFEMYAQKNVKCNTIMRIKMGINYIKCNYLCIVFLCKTSEQ